MSLGLSIFLSSLVLGAVALFIATKDRWNWRRLILRWLLLSIVLVVMTVVGGLIALEITSRPRVQESFWDIPLGAGQADIRFLKGQPSKIHNGRWHRWLYDVNCYDGNRLYRVGFTKDNVAYVAGEGELQGIRTHHSTPEDVRKKFGEPTEVFTTEDDLGRWFYYAEYRVFFYMEKNTVVTVGMYDPSVVRRVAGSQPADPNAPDSSTRQTSG